MRRGEPRDAGAHAITRCSRQVCAFARSAAGSATAHTAIDMSPDTEGGTPAVAPPPKRRRRRRYALVILGLLVLVAVLGGIKFAQINSLIGFGKNAAIQGPPPEAVSTDVAQASAWEASRAAVGSISGVRSVAVSNDSPGIVLRIGFDSGDVVKRGQVLLELDASPEKAQVEAAKAKLSHAQATVKRSRILAEKDALTGEQLDIDETALKSAVAEVEAAEAAIDRKIVRAPFSGRLGIRAVNLGQYLNPGTPMTSLESIECAFVDFTLPQQRAGQLSGLGMPVRIDGAAARRSRSQERSFGGRSHRRCVVAQRADTRRADDPNRRGCAPACSSTWRSSSRTSTDGRPVPATAIVHASYGDSVFIIEDKKPDAAGLRSDARRQAVKVARQQFVRLGAARGDFVAIIDGVKAGQEVVSAGAFKLRNGSPVVVDNTTSQPSAAARPSSRKSLRRHEVHRYLHPPAGARDRRQPRDHRRRAAGDPLAQRSPVSEARERDGHGHARSTSAPTPISCAASSRRRSSARSPPPTASTTSSRRASRASRRSTSA